MWIIGKERSRRSVPTNFSVHELFNTASYCVPAPSKREAVVSLLCVAEDNNTYGEPTVTREEIYEIISSQGQSLGAIAVIGHLGYYRKLSTTLRRS